MYIIVTVWNSVDSPLVDAPIELDTTTNTLSAAHARANEIVESEQFGDDDDIKVFYHDGEEVLSYHPDDGFMVTMKGVRLSREEVINTDEIDRLKADSSKAMRAGKIQESIRLYNKAWEMERGGK